MGRGGGMIEPSQLLSVPIQENDSDERYTPRWVFDGLGLDFDLDPASPVGGGDCVPARKKYTRNDDGLDQRWNGLVWLNPPFSEATKWADKFRDHGDGIFLGPVANARWWLDLVRVADLVWHCRDFAFTHPTHAGRRSSMPLAFVALGSTAAVGLVRLARSERHAGVLMQVTR